MNIDQAVVIVKAVESVVSDNPNFTGRPKFRAFIEPEDVDNVSRYRVKVRKHGSGADVTAWDDVVSAIKKADHDAWWRPMGEGAIEVRT